MIPSAPARPPFPHPRMRVRAKSYLIAVGGLIGLLAVIAFIG